MRIATFLGSVLATSCLVNGAPSNILERDTTMSSARRLFKRHHVYDYFTPCTGVFTPWKYDGCYTDGGFGWEHPYLSYNANFGQGDLTIEQCTAYCKGAGFRLAGVSGGAGSKWCYCGSGIPKDQKLDDDSTCNVPCDDGSNKCGGRSWSVWKDPTFNDNFNAEKEAKGYKSVGCLYSKGVWIITDYLKDASGRSCSITNCGKACAARGFAYMGVYNGDQCWCGGQMSETEVARNEEWGDLSQYCTTPCPGKSSEICGSQYYYSMYYNSNLGSKAPCGELAPVDDKVKDQDIPPPNEEEKDESENPEKEKPEIDKDEDDKTKKPPSPPAATKPPSPSTKQTTKQTSQPAKPEKTAPSVKTTTQPQKASPSPSDSLCNMPNPPVGGNNCRAPIVGCNNEKAAPSDKYYKLYTSSTTCRWYYKKTIKELVAACWNSCIEQQQLCLSYYAKGGETKKKKCNDEFTACKAANNEKTLSSAFDLGCSPSKPQSSNNGYY